jgi:hypothetical protein
MCLPRRKTVLSKVVNHFLYRKTTAWSTGGQELLFPNNKDR